MKTHTLIFWALLFHVQVIFGQIFSLSDSIPQFQCEKKIIHFDGDINDSLIVDQKIYFLIDKKPIKKDNRNYYKFRLSEDSTDNFNGYLRKEFNKIFVIPIDSSLNIKNERVLFDFNTKKGKSWQTYSLGLFSGDSVKFLRKYYDKTQQDYLYEYNMSGLNLTTIIDKLIVSENKGIVKVIFLTHYGFCLECTKKIKITFTNTRS